MDLSQFTKDCTVTESVKDQITVNMKMLTDILVIYTAAGSILDQFKKNMFYSKPFNIEKLDGHIHDMFTASHEFHALQLRNELSNIDKVDAVIEDTKSIRVSHALIGSMTEATELGEAFIKFLNTGEFDFVNLGEEYGDQNWYQAIFSDATGITMESTMEKVIAKLKARYPEGFTDHHANNRDLEAERKILES